ncbi:MAG TPA: HNH endonuclease signature motif containing protein [Candidatus Eisenbacteria bacterium]|nr:HNH endonuclease signature motif containing protein [Candidatus Eisenbacteria bacterium]
MAHIAEIDERQLYLPAGYASMHAYCVGELKLSEEAGFKRIHAGRTARRFPRIFRALAEGRLHLSAVILLAPHLDSESAEGLIEAAEGRSKSEIEALLVERYPRLELATGLCAVAVPEDPRFGNASSAEVGEAVQHAPGRVGAASKMTPVAPQRYAFEVIIDQVTFDKLRRAEELLAHTVPAGDMSKVLGRVLDLAIGQLEKRKFGATDNPRDARPSTDIRHIPAHVKRAVYERDGGQCTFAGESGHRCAEKRGLEFDHIEPVARGGRTTVENLRLRCRPHNQYEAGRVFGTEFMNQKREAARRARERIDEVAHCLRQLRYRAHEARRAAEFSDSIPSAPLEERVKRALTWFAPRVSSAAG